MAHSFFKEKLSRRSMCFVLSFSCPTLHSAAAEGRCSAAPTRLSFSHLRGRKRRSGKTTADRKHISTLTSIIRFDLYFLL